MPDTERILANLPRATTRLSAPETLRDLDRRFYDEAAQTMPREQLRELQDERLREAIRRVFERPIPFFRRKLEDTGVEGPDDVKGVDDLARIPVTVKQELRDAEAAHPPVGDYRGTDLRENVRIGTSTGTTGTPTVMLWTRHDLLVDCDTGARAFWRQGIRPGMVLTHAHPAYLYSGGAMLTSTYEHLGCLPVWVPPPDTDELAVQGLDMWKRITPDRPFMGFATGRFLEVAKAQGIEPEEVGLDFSKMPPLSQPGDPALPLMTAGAECMAYLGSPCEQLNGGHLCEDHAIVQVLDDEGVELGDGEWGRLVVTTIGRDNFLIRYDLEEAARVERRPCPCGETHARGWWGGRMKDLVRSQGRSFMLFDIERPLKSVRAIRKPSLEYVVVRPTDPAAPLRIRVEASSDVEASGREAEAALREALGVAVEVDALERGELPRAGYKATRVVDA